MDQGESYEIKLIDVERRYLVSIPFSELHQYTYVALSYVWGPKEQPLGLYRGNSEALHRDGGISNASRTVEDAMKVTKELGYQFLWVDVLCVMQDDVSRKAADISHMYQIYTQADLTIVAAGDGTANQGLPGISYERAAQRSAQVKPDLWLYTTMKQPLITQSGIALDCPWSTRGWTLQEQVLSLRCLFSLEDQVTWRCQSRDRFEDLLLEQTSEQPLHLRLEWARAQPEEQMHKLRHAKPLHVANIFYIEDPFGFQKNFAALAEAYAKRTLSFNSDTENAFQGILTGLVKDFHRGVPVKRFEEYLCWTRRNPKEQLLCRRNDCPVPSWSWIAWTGPISFEYIQFTMFPAIIYYKLVAQTEGDAERLVLELEAVTQKRFSELSAQGYHEHSDVRSYETEEADREWTKLQDNPQNRPSISNMNGIDINLDHLLFYANVAERVEVNLISSQRTGKETRMDTYEILDTEQRQNPLLKFKELRFEELIFKNSTFNTVVSVDAADPTTTTKPEIQRKYHSLFAVANLHYPSYRYREGSEVCDFVCDRVCVMRVSWHGRIALREGVHIINSKQWESLRKTKQLIVLG